MRRSAWAVCALILVAVPAAAQRLASYEGRKSAQPGAQKVYELLPTVCPRVAQSKPDILDYSLHVGFPDDDGIYGQLARAYEATEVVAVTLRANIAGKVVPKAITAANHWANLAVIASKDGTTVVALSDPLGYWLCNKSPEAGQDLALVSASQLTPAIAH